MKPEKTCSGRISASEDRAASTGADCSTSSRACGSAGLIATGFFFFLLLLLLPKAARKALEGGGGGGGAQRRASQAGCCCCCCFGRRGLGAFEA